VLDLTIILVSLREHLQLAKKIKMCFFFWLEVRTVFYVQNYHLPIKSKSTQFLLYLGGFAEDLFGHHKAELSNYIKDGKLAHTAILFLVAQEQIHMGTSRKKKGNSKSDWFPTILDNNITLPLEKGQNRIEQEQVDAKIKLNHTVPLFTKSW
jgi:hypothetical protein